MTTANNTGVACPACNSTICAVKDSRPKDDGAYVRRRRCCESCGFRFTTHERAVENDDDQQSRLALFEAIMAQSRQLEALARTIVSPREAAQRRRRVEVGATAIQAMLDQEAWVNRYEPGRPWFEDDLWSLVLLPEGGRGRRAVHCVALIKWSGPPDCDPRAPVYWDEATASFNQEETGLLIPGWTLHNPHIFNGLAKVSIP